MACAELTASQPRGDIFISTPHTELPNPHVTTYSIDVDHAIWNQGSIRKNQMLQIDQYSEATRAIFHDLVDKALNGDIIIFNSGKGVNLVPLRRYLRSAIHDEMHARGMSEEEYRDPDIKRLLSVDKTRPVMMFFSIENGANWCDIFDPQKRLHQHKLSIETWETLADPRIAQLLQDSTDKKRIETLARVTPRFQKPGDYKPLYQPTINPLSPEEFRLARYQDYLGHLACVSPWNTKTNLVFDMEKVLNGPDLMVRWGEIADTPILKQEEQMLDKKEQKRIAGERLLLALRRLLPTNNIFHSYANGTHFYDIAPGGIDKGTVVREIQNYAAYVYREMRLRAIIPDFSRKISIGDGNPIDSNDAPMYKIDGMAVSNRQHAGILYIGDLLAQTPNYRDGEADEIEKVRLFLRYAQEHSDLIAQQSH
jgi:hypothetical protein